MEGEKHTVDMKVYDVPVELKNQYISMAKLDYDNQVWRVMEEGMSRLLDERHNKVGELEMKLEAQRKQIMTLNERINELSKLSDNKEQSKKDDLAPPATFGGDDEELLDRFDKGD